MRRLGNEGRAVIVSSHVLSEVQRFANNVLVIVNGKLAAAGNYQTIRTRMDERDLLVRVRCSDARRLASHLVIEPSVSSVRFVDDERLVIETNDMRRFGEAVPVLARREDIRLLELQAIDDSLASVFAYLVGR
jgi:ABC-2 type transport system ATP-binding protein